MSNRSNVKSLKNKTTNAHERSKDFFSSEEVKVLLSATKKTRYATRNYLIILMMFRHGLRVSELINIKLSDLNLKESRIWIRRLKNGLSVEHPISGDELRYIRRYLRLRNSEMPWLFINERKQPLTRQAVNYLMKTIGLKTNLDVHPHKLRHSCGYYLANQGYDLRLIQDYLGHRDPKQTVHYTRITSKRFERLWE